jgi:Rad3-related DNA helicase
MLFHDEFFKVLPDEPHTAALAICDAADIWFRTMAQKGAQKGDEKDAIELLAVLNEFEIRHPLYKDITLPSPELPLPNLVDAMRGVVNAIRLRASAEVQKNSFETMKSAVAARFPKGFAIEFTEGDLNRIQQLINELREHISQSTHFVEEHRQRVLRRLERLQQELHKRMSDADRFFGLLVDAGVALGKFGKEAKPFVDHITEILKIVWRTQARAEELPSDAPFPVLEDRRKSEPEK